MYTPICKEHEQILSAMYIREHGQQSPEGTEGSKNTKLGPIQ
jgi:hypothetical protein